MSWERIYQIKMMKDGYHWNMTQYGYAESTIIQKIKDEARSEGCTEFSMWKDGRFMGVWEYDSKSKKWRMIAGKKWW